MSRILVTGGAGFLGSCIAAELENEGHLVSVVDDLSGGFIDNVPEVSDFYHVDLSDAKLAEGVVYSSKPEVLFHLASNAREGASYYQPRSITQRNLTAYVNVLTPCIKYGIQRVVCFSSMSIYGDQEPPFSEDMPLKPVDVYATNKVAMEMVTQQLAACHGFDWLIIRPHNVGGAVCGPDGVWRGQSLCDNFRNFLAIEMNLIMRGEPMRIYGDGTQKRSFSYIKDSLPCYLRCLSDVNNTIFNIGGMNHISINEAADVIRNAMGVPNHPIEYLPDRHGEVKMAYTTYSKSVEQLGYHETHTFDEWIQKMADWAKTKGPQEWKNSDPIELPNENMPSVWN